MGLAATWPPPAWRQAAPLSRFLRTRCPLCFPGPGMSWSGAWPTLAHLVFLPQLGAPAPGGSGQSWAPLWVEQLGVLPPPACLSPHPLVHPRSAPAPTSWSLLQECWAV